MFSCGLPKGSLQYASIEGDVETVRARLVEGIVDVNARNQHLWTSLHSAAEYGRVDVIELLIQAHADLNAGTSAGCTPLHRASMRGRVNAVEMLLQAGADPHARDEEGNTPLHRACAFRESGAVRVYFAFGADLHAKGSQRHEPLHELFNGMDATTETLLTLQVLVSHGAAWDATCDELATTNKINEEASALRVCMDLWTQEHIDGLPLTDIPLDVVKRGAACTQTFIDAFKTARTIVPSSAS